MICGLCGFEGLPVGGVCRNCSAPFPGASAADPAPAQEIPPLDPRADVAGAVAGLYGLLAATGEDPDRPELAGTPQGAVDALLALTAGYDLDPSAVLSGGPAGTEGAGRATLYASVPIRTACERCLLPVFGEVYLRCAPAGQPLDGGQLARLVFCLSARLQTEGQLAEQLVAAVVGLGGASSASTRVSFRRPCDGCGAGRVMTTARARRVSPAGGDPPQDGRDGARCP